MNPPSNKGSKEKKVIPKVSSSRNIRGRLHQLAEAIEQCGVPFLITDTSGTIEYVNEKMTSLTGYSREELVGQNPRILKSGKTPANVYKALWKRILSGSTWHGVLYNRRKDGEEYLESIFISPILDSEGQTSYFVGTWQDITTHVAKEKALEREIEIIKMTSDELEQFAFRASHDLKSPLRKIIAFSEQLIVEEPHLSPEGKDTIRRIQRATTRMKNLIERTLELSNVTTASQVTAEVDLKALVNEVVSDLKQMIQQKRARVDIHELPACHGDVTQLYQLFLNLISNAIKFQGQDRMPHVVIEGRIIDQKNVEITVNDNGIGFDEIYLDQIFKPFERLNAAHKFEGSGMGLSICHKVVERHGGSIHAHSMKDKGTTFIITLPLK